MSEKRERIASSRACPTNLHFLLLWPLLLHTYMYVYICIICADSVVVVAAAPC